MATNDDFDVDDLLEAPYKKPVSINKLKVAFIAYQNFD